MKVMNDMTVSVLDLSDSDKFLADIKNEFIATGLQVDAEQLFRRRYNKLNKTSVYTKYDFALPAFEHLYGGKPCCG